MKFWGYLQKLKKENSLLTIAVIILTVGIIALTATLFKVVDEKVVVVLPPKVDKEFWVSGDTLSPAYLEQVGTFVADRFLSNNPYNVDHSFSMILPFLTDKTKVAKKIKKKLDEQASLIKKEDIAQVFYPMEFKILKKGGQKIQIVGMHKQTISGVMIGNKKITLQLPFTISKGRLKITEMKVIS